MQEYVVHECTVVGEAWDWEVCSCFGSMMSFDMLEGVSMVSMQT